MVDLNLTFDLDSTVAPTYIRFKFHVNKRMKQESTAGPVRL